VNEKEMATPIRHYRKWPLAEKLRLLDEAANSTVNGTATRNSLAATQLFKWRKRLCPSVH